MLKKLTVFLFTAFVLFFAFSPVYARSLPDGDLNRQQAIDTFFADATGDLLEGIWLTADDKYEIAITKNDFSVCEGYDYLGFTVQTTDTAWTKGKIKLQLKATSVPKLYIGYFHKKTDGYLNLADAQSAGTAFRLTGNDTIEYTNEKKEKKLLYRVYPGNTATSLDYTRSGSGFFITDNLVVTNHHVVDNAKTIEVKFNNNQKATATVVSRDPVNDLALLKIDKKDFAVTPLPLAANQAVKDGETVYTVGFPIPGLLGTKPKLSEGVVNSITGYLDDVRMYQISNPIQPGNSGGPLLNSRGRVVGVVTASVNPYRSLILTGSFPQNVNFAMKINYVDNLISTLPEKVRLANAKAYGSLTPAEIMAEAKEAIVQVLVK